MSLQSKRALLKAGAGALAMLAGAAAPQASAVTGAPLRPTVREAVQRAQAEAVTPVAEQKPATLGTVKLAPGVKLQGESGKRVSPATEKLLRDLSSTVARRDPKAGADTEHVQYSYSRDAQGRTQQEIIVR